MFIVLSTSSFQVEAIQESGVSAVSNSDRSWRLLSELSDEEIRRIDLSTNTPRDSIFPYLPEEPYPFSPPYTAEEMGYRSMEFPHIARWNHVLAEDSGTLTPTGYLVIGQFIILAKYFGTPGLMGQISTRPGKKVSEWLIQDIAPPEKYGNQLLWGTYRTDQTFQQKADMFAYSPGLRRVRRFPSPRRQDRYPNQPSTYDDASGRDAWEFSWRIIGTDVLYETARFPVTRRSMTLRNADGTFFEVSADSLKLMGDDYPYYTDKNGVPCYVVEAIAKEDWLPGYYAPRILYWLDQEYFYPLRTETYGPDGELLLIDTRVAKLMNPSLDFQGYHNLISLWWDARQDFYSYGVHDSHQQTDWTKVESSLYFSPDFMRRAWFPIPLKTQSGVKSPEEFFLRPYLHRDKFPGERVITLSPDLEARIHAQDQAGQIVFIDGGISQAE